VRHSSVRVRSEDHYIAPGNGDDSGSVDYQATTPVLGATFKLSHAVNLYAAYGKGFETPTFNELSYRSTSGNATGLNFGLAPAKSDHVEFGIKAKIGRTMLINAAVFHIDTKDELAVLANSGGRAVYQNVGATRRDGLELGIAGRWHNGLNLQLAYSLLRARYADAFCSGPCTGSNQVAAGNRLPGVPQQSWYGELGWLHAPSGFSTALETRYASRVYVDDENSDAAPSYFIASIRAGFEQAAGKWRLREFARIDNLFDRKYAGSVIVNESNQRYFEPAPGRNYWLGAHLAYAW
jgi:iron complex outermembrane receptor protein